MEGDYEAREFKLMARHIRIIAETMLTQFFGERCPDFEPDCLYCQRWKALDQLIDDPFAEEAKAGE